MRQTSFSESGLVGLEQTRRELGLTEEKGSGFSFWKWFDRKIKEFRQLHHKLIL